MKTELKRQGIHIGLLLFALTLKWLEQWQAVGLLVLLLLVTMSIVPKSRLRWHLHRATEQRFSDGAIFYFLTLILLLLFFRPLVVAGAWAILALGDGMATLVGRLVDGKRLPWNRHKTVAGSVAFLIFGAVGAAAMLRWMLPDFSWPAGLWIGLRVALIAGLVESLPLKLNDNVTVAITAAVGLEWLL